MDYIDLQVNGAFGIDFNSDELSIHDFKTACERLREIGVVGMLPTIITDSIATMGRRIRKIVTAIESFPELVPLVRGIHVEGPFLSSIHGFYGTHPPQHIRAANLDDTLQLLEAGSGHVRLLTLAPEQDPTGSVTARLRQEKVLVFAGHTNATFDELKRSIDHGLVGFTHLGNGCVHQVDRQDNIMQRALALREHLMITLIADGIHLPDWLVRSWLSIIGDDRSIVVSDSMSAAGMPPGTYAIGGQQIMVEPSRRTRHAEHGYLAGSSSTMADMDRWLEQSLALEPNLRQRILHDNAYELLTRDI